MSDIVYNFRWLTDREINLMFPNPSKWAIHYTAYASEGRLYVPWLKKRLTEFGAVFIRKEFQNLNQVADEGFDFVLNCGGYNASLLAGDDQPLQPIRGIIFEASLCVNALLSSFRWRLLGTNTSITATLQLLRSQCRIP